MATVIRTVPHHDTLTCYTDYDCRLPACVDRYRTWNRERVRAITAGTWQPFVDATPVREHLLKLHAAGATSHQIAQIVGVDWTAVRSFTEPHIEKRRGITQRTRPDLAARILAIDVGDATPARIDATGTRRRLQALCTIGFPLSSLGEHIGVCPDYVRAIAARQKTVFGTTARATVNAYDKLRNEKPRRHGVTKLATQRARRRAKEHRWPPPTYWDECGAIDDPHFTPDYGFTRAELLAQEAHWLITTAGLNRTQAAERLGKDRSYIDRVLVDHPQKEAA